MSGRLPQAPDLPAADLRVQVSWADICAGRWLDPAHCPLALALNRLTGDRWLVDPRNALRLSDHREFQHDGGGFVETFDLLKYLAVFARRTVRLTGRSA